MKLQRNVSLLSFDEDVLHAAAEAAPAVRRVLNLRPPRRPGRALRELIPTLSAVSADVRSLTPGFADAVRELGRPLYAYTCNTPSRVERALAAKVLGVMSDRPEWLARRLASRRDRA
jgi:glycerophosphoryl diester phosphodiesterase